jgi:hypothetical protein
VRTATFQHVDGHAVTVFIEHVVCVQIGKDGKNGDCTMIQFSSGWSIPVIENRLDILQIFDMATSSEVNDADA